MLSKLTLILMSMATSAIGSAIYVNLAASRPSADPIHTFSVRGCIVAYDSHRTKPFDFCYPFPARVSIIGYKAGGYTNASIVVRITNLGNSPIKLPIGAQWIPSGGDERSRLEFSPSLGNVNWPLNTAYAYGDPRDPSSIATVQPGECVDYQVPLDLREAGTKAGMAHGTTIPVVVKVGLAVMKKQADGEWTGMMDKGQIPSNPFRIPY